jgi:hypothetical protein
VLLGQRVISFPFSSRYLFAAHRQAMSKVLGIVYRAISTHLIHFHIQFLEGAYVYHDNRPPRLRQCGDQFTRSSGSATELQKAIWGQSKNTWILSAVWARKL